jgi:hypothetical protein
VVQTDYPYALRERLGSQGAAALADVLTSQQSDTVTLAVERFDQRLAEECDGLRLEMRREMATLRADLGTQMKELHMELRADFANVRADLLKWSFVFWIGQFAAVVAYIALIR